jgi:spore coat protein A, manganese oxidase
MSNRIIFILATMLTFAMLIFPAVPVRAAVGPLNPSTLIKWTDPLVIPPVMAPKSPNYYEIGVYQIQQGILPSNYVDPDTGFYPKTTVWGYGSSAATAHYPAYTIETTQGTPINIKWTNDLVDYLGNAIRHPLPVDTTIDNAYTTSGLNPATDPVPIVTHVHGAEVQTTSDGEPNSYFTPGYAVKGPTWTQETYSYPISNPPSTLWYHDHAMGLTRLNVYMGLAGFFIVRNPAAEPAGLPGSAPKLDENTFDPANYNKYREIPIAIQDRMFNTDGSLNFPSSTEFGHTTWVPEFTGDTIVVNGTAWPYFNVVQGKYRFRLLEGSNARSYDLYLSTDPTLYDPSIGDPTVIVDGMTQIGTDGGYLASPIPLSKLLMMPGERADVVVDFSSFAPGTDVYLKNDANTPYPGGDQVDANTSLILKFHVTGPPVPADTSTIPATLSNFTDLTVDTPKVITQRVLTEVVDPNTHMPVGMFLDGEAFMTATDVLPEYGTTEEWQFVNLTMDTHPMHTHLVQFQMLNRQRIDVPGYLNAFLAANPEYPNSTGYNGSPMGLMSTSVKPNLSTFLVGSPIAPDPNERGWKDTIHAFPDMVTSVILRFSPQSSIPVTTYDFDPTVGDYVWHCHIIDHEDNEMMRPYRVVMKTNVTANNQCTKSGKPVEFTASFNDSTNNTNPDTHRAIIDWGDGTTSNGFVSELNGEGTIQGTHEYARSGFAVYNVKVTIIENKWGGIGISMFTITVSPGVPGVTDRGIGIEIAALAACIIFLISRRRTHRSSPR